MTAFHIIIRCFPILLLLAAAVQAAEKTEAELRQEKLDNFVLPANASWVDHVLLEVIRNPYTYLSWLAAFSFPLLLAAMWASWQLLKDIKRQEKVGRLVWLHMCVTCARSFRRASRRRSVCRAVTRSRAAHSLDFFLSCRVNWPLTRLFRLTHLHAPEQKQRKKERARKKAIEQAAKEGDDGEADGKLAKPKSAKSKKAD